MAGPGQIQTSSRAVQGRVAQEALLGTATPLLPSCCSFHGPPRTSAWLLGLGALSSPHPTPQSYSLHRDTCSSPSCQSSNPISPHYFRDGRGLFTTMEPSGAGYLRDEADSHNFAVVVYELWCLKDSAPYRANMASFLMAAPYLESCRFEHLEDRL